MARFAKRLGGGPESRAKFRGSGVCESGVRLPDSGSGVCESGVRQPNSGSGVWRSIGSRPQNNSTQSPDLCFFLPLFF